MATTVFITVLSYSGIQLSDWVKGGRRINSVLIGTPFLLPGDMERYPILYIVLLLLPKLALGMV